MRYCGAVGVGRQSIANPPSPRLRGTSRESEMSLLVTGSIGIDTVEAPWGKVKDALGGSSIYFAQAASFFGPVRLVGVVGEDCPEDFLKPLHENPNIDMAGLEVRRGSKTFRWHGRYQEDVNLRDTVSVELNVLTERVPPRGECVLVPARVAFDLDFLETALTLGSLPSFRGLGRPSYRARSGPLRVIRFL